MMKRNEGHKKIEKPKKEGLTKGRKGIEKTMERWEVSLKGGQKEGIKNI